MPMRKRVVAEVRLECNGHLVVAYLPIVSGEFTADRLREPLNWFIEVDEGTGFPGPPYHPYLTGEEEKAREEIRRFLKGDPRVARRARRTPA